MQRIVPFAAVALLLATVPALAAQDSIVIGVQQEPATLDPTTDGAAAIDAMLTANVFETLVTVDQSGQPQPALAKSWEVSADGLTYSFHLVNATTFHDGILFNAADVVFSLDRARAPDGKNPSKALFAAIDKVEAADDLTVVVRLKHPDAFFLTDLAQGAAAILAPETADGDPTQPVGTGPFKLKEWRHGDRLVLERNDAWRGAKDVALREVTFRFIADPAAATGALQAGEIDAFPDMAAPEAVVQFQNDPRFKVMVGTTEAEAILALNNARKPFDDIRVRRALSYAIDRQAIISGAMFGYGTVIGSHFPPQDPAYVDLTGLYPHDAAKAKALLADAGYPDGFTARLDLPPGPSAARLGGLVAAQLAEAGVKADIVTMDAGGWADAIGRTDYDMAVIAQAAPHAIESYADGAYGYANPRAKDLWDQIVGATDPAILQAREQDLQRLIAEEAVNVFLFELPRLGIAKSGVEGLWANAPVNFSPLSGVRWAE